MSLANYTSEGPCRYILQREKDGGLFYFLFYMYSVSTHVVSRRSDRTVKSVYICACLSNVCPEYSDCVSMLC